MDNKGERIAYSKGDLIALCGGLVRKKFSGRLEVYHQHTRRVLMLIDGELAGMVSDLSTESIARQLLLDEVVSKGDISRASGKNRHEGRSGDGMRLEEALLRRRKLSYQDLSESNHRRIDVAMGAVFGLDGAEYSLFPNDKIGMVNGVGIQEGLVSTQSLLAVFWRPATRASEWIMGEVTKFKGPLVPLVDFKQAISELEGVAFPLERFVMVMRRCPTVEALYLEFPHETALFPLLWLLAQYGAISASNEEETKKPEKVPPSPTTRVGAHSAVQRSLQEWEGLIEEMYDERVGLDCYGFISSPPSSSRDEIDVACKEMLKTLKPALMVQSMSEERFEKLDKLLIGVKNVWLTLSDPVLRKRYDSSLAAGVKFKVSCVPGAEPIRLQDEESTPQSIETDPISPHLKRGLDLIERGLFAKALPLLEEDRLRSPNSATVLTGIARAHFGLGRIEDSLDFFNLALVFSPSDYRALRGVVEVHLNNNDLDEAQEYLKALADIHPFDEWVQAQMSAFDKAGKGDKRSLFSWRRKRK